MALPETPQRTGPAGTDGGGPPGGANQVRPTPWSQPGGAGGQPLMSGPALVIVNRMITRRSRSIAAR
jgi:hypothetical protein